MIGLGTALADDPALTVRLPGVDRKPLRVVLDTHLRLPARSRLAATARNIPTLVVAGADAPNEASLRLADLGVVIERVGLDADGRVDLNQALRALSVRGVTRVFSEGGPRVAARLIALKLADDVALITADKPLGRPGVPALAAQARAALLDPSRYRLVETMVYGADTMRVWERVRLIGIWAPDGARLPNSTGGEPRLRRGVQFSRDLSLQSLGRVFLQLSNCCLRKGFAWDGFVGLARARPDQPTVIALAFGIFQVEGRVNPCDRNRREPFGDSRPLLRRRFSPDQKAQARLGTKPASFTSGSAPPSRRPSASPSRTVRRSRSPSSRPRSGSPSTDPARSRRQRAEQAVGFVCEARSEQDVVAVGHEPPKIGLVKRLAIRPIQLAEVLIGPG